jgi:hypothetical protein
MDTQLNTVPCGHYHRALPNDRLTVNEQMKFLSLGNACYKSVQKVLSSRLLSKNVKIRIYKEYHLLGYDETLHNHRCENLKSYIEYTKL